jgi:hypothetical protein
MCVKKAHGTMIEDEDEDEDEIDPEYRSGLT